jgi:Tfp pilus assembly protein FimV
MNRIFSNFIAPLPRWLWVGLCTLPMCTLTLYTAPALAASEATTPALAIYTTQAGDTVERVLKNAMPDSPLNPSLLRKALVDANPNVVSGKVGQKFKTGTVIHVPEHAALVRSTLETYAPLGTESAPRNGFSASDPASRRHWIRYP